MIIYTQFKWYYVNIDSSSLGFGPGLRLKVDNILDRIDLLYTVYQHILTGKKV